MANKKWLIPSYYTKFKCKCEKCRHTCCSSWKITVSQKEYFELIGMECSKELHEKIEASFIEPEFPTTEVYKYISYNWLGNCPMQKDGLCLLHKEKGADHLPLICRLYPRSLKEINGHLIGCLSSSCERVIELLKDEKDFKLVYEDINEVPTIKLDLDNKIIDDIININNILKSFNSLKDNIKTICRQVNKDEFDKEYETSSDPLIEALNILDRFKSSDSFFEEINDKLQERYKDSSQYYIDKENFKKKYPDYDKFFMNVINNSLLYETFPFVDDRFDKTNAFKGLCASYGLLCLFAVGYTSINDDENSLIDATSELFHLIEHTAFYYNVNIITNKAASLLKL